MLPILTCAAVLAAGGARPVAAQDGPEWELQRCIWSCLSAFGPADNPAYAACVAQRCPPEAAPAPVPWASGPTADGRGAFAGTRSEADPDVLFYLFCAPGGQRILQLAGVEGGPGPNALVLAVDGQGFPVSFTGAGDGAGDLSVLASLPPGAPLLGALMRGQSLEIRNGAGFALGRFGLAGAGPAISGALARCR
ncbi:hypothetical protein [Rhodovulum kholense]|uniref:hypothetical protein n=1 Tax=Rhodovulum kholense TaxID=453584 RepID=UPI000D3D3F62|nr:hypothetical protein [Rhodovulum kholense]